MCGPECVAYPYFTDAENRTDYAIVFRYLDAPHEPDEQEALDALHTGQRLYQAVSALLALAERP